MKIRSAPLYPISFVPTNFALNNTPEGIHQVVRVLKPGLPHEGEFEVLYEGPYEACQEFIHQKAGQEFPGL